MRKGRTPILTLFISSLLLINTVMVSEDIRASNDRIKEEKTLTNKSFASIHHMLYSQMYKHMIEMMKHELRILRELSKILPENIHSSTYSLQNQDHGKVKSSRGKGRTLYVGGTGPNNYTKIQDAINEANDGDTIFVYSGVYEENFVINKTVTLVGEKRKATIIDGSYKEYIVIIHSSNVTIQNFTLRCGDYGIAIVGYYKDTDYNTITDTTVESCKYAGISIFGNYGNSNYNTITNITVRNCNLAGVLFDGYHGSSNHNTITNTTMENCGDGIRIAGFFGNSNYNTITNTAIENCKFAGMTIIGYSGNSNYNTITNTAIENCGYGIFIGGLFGKSNHNTITDTIIENCKFIGVTITGAFGNSNHNTITNTTVENCLYGIATTGFFGNSNYNKVVNSLVTNNSVGVYILGIGSAENTFYLNRFINNTDGNAFALSKNIWDNGTVGNYWDDYNGNDSDGDGIGDIPYKIPPLEEVNKDRYPLGRFLTNITPPPEKNPPKIRLKEPLPAAIYVGKHPLEIAFFVPLLWNKTLVFFSTKGITIKVAAIDYESGIDRVEFYVDDETKPRDIEIKQYPEQYIFEWCWDETMLCEEHVVRAVAYDKANNSATLTINIKVILSVHLYRIWQ